MPGSLPPGEYKIHIQTKDHKYQAYSTPFSIQ